MDTFEKAYSPKEIITTLDIADSTLRKWCLALEKNGYKFIRNDNKNRTFVEGDLVVLKHFQNLVKHHNMQLENASRLVIDRFGKGAFEVGTDTVLAEKEEEERSLVRSDTEKIQPFIDHMVNAILEKQGQQHSAEIKALVNQIEALKSEQLRESMEQRKIMNEVKDMLIAQKELAAGQEKKGFWARLFNK